jgi:catechol 2,3-dioxygenase-like lactoylglutathione lyase family enzyme
LAPREAEEQWMIGYVTIGMLDAEKSGRFYDAVMNAIGNERKFYEGGWIGYGPKGEDSHGVYICPPHDGKPATAGNGTMIAFVAPSKDAVHHAYETALTNGGADEGAPGPRPADSTTFYGCYLRDPTGNKICVYAKGPF